jgi:hypothetical protein
VSGDEPGDCDLPNATCNKWNAELLSGNTRQHAKEMVNSAICMNWSNTRKGTNTSIATKLMMIVMMNTSTALMITLILIMITTDNDNYHLL